MPEMEARPPAENRHGGAPRGERPASWGAPHPAGCGSVASHERDNRDSAPVGAPPTPPRGMDAITRRKSGRSNAPRERRRLRCLTSWMRVRPTVRCARRDLACALARVPGERASANEDPGPRGDTTDGAARFLRCWGGRPPTASVCQN